MGRKNAVNGGLPKPRLAATRSPDNGNRVEDQEHMASRSADFASLLCSRLCHDLLSPVGAFNNGLELLVDETDPEMRARCMELLTESAQASANKLKFFRIAFGAAGGFGETIDTREARAAIEGLHGGASRVQVGWMVEDGARSKNAIKILLNLALIAGDGLVRGGRLDIGAEGGEVVIRAEGARIVLDPELRNALMGEADEGLLNPRAAAAWLVHLLIEEEGGALQILEPEPGVLMFGVTLPN
jgi:histidine phosphotransferase ChpT